MKHCNKKLHKVSNFGKYMPVITEKIGIHSERTQQLLSSFHKLNIVFIFKKLHLHFLANALKARI
jgi:hypothetical protein